MGGLSIWHWLVVAIVVMLFFGGRGKVSELMGDFAKGIKAFKKGMADDEEKPQAQAVPPITANEPVRTLPPHPAEPVHTAPVHAAPQGATPDRKVG